MDKNVIIQMKFSGDNVALLYHVYDDLFYNYEVQTAHDWLLEAHIVEFRDKLNRMVDRGQINYTLAFSLSETVAFVQVWKDAIKPLPYRSAAIIQAIFDKLDKKAKQPRHGNRLLANGN